MRSVGQMVLDLDSLRKRRIHELTQWEDKFMTSIVKKTDCGKNTGSLSEKQVTAIDQLHRKLFVVSDKH